MYQQQRRPTRSGLLNCGHMSIWFGIGNRANMPSQTRPICIPGKVPAQMTAKIVIASAKRLIAVLHFCLKRKRIAEINVPAWPMPTQNTKLTIGYPHATGLLFPHTPTPVNMRYPINKPSIDINEKEIPRAMYQDFGGLGDSLPFNMSSVTDPNVVWFKINCDR